MDKLPPELLAKILLYLPMLDRLSCSLTCRRWAEAMSSSQLLHDVWLGIAGREIEKAAPVLVNSQRQYPNLLLFEANLSEVNSAFWGKISENLRVLELNSCLWPAHIFYAGLQQCSKLESLKIVSSKMVGEYQTTIMDEDFVVPENFSRGKLQDSLTHLRHLHLDFNFTAEVLDLLLGLLSNVTSIFVSPGDDDNSDFVERLPHILNKNRISCTRVNWEFGIDSERATKFLEETSGSLEELQMFVWDFKESAFDAIAKCTRLRVLRLTGYPEFFGVRPLEKLVSNSPQLEILDVWYDKDSTDEDMVHLLELKKLRALSLTSHKTTITNDFMCRLIEIPSLVKLDFNGFLANNDQIRSLGCLTNLRSLRIGQVDSEGFEIICRNFDRLTELHLRNASRLTDADGQKLCHFGGLRSLSVSNGRRLGDRTFERGVGSRAMRSLVIRNCSLTDAGLLSIASHHNCLEKLVLEECKDLSETGVLTLLKNEPRLKELTVKYCASVELWNQTFKDLCPRLRDSSVWYRSIPPDDDDYDDYHDYA